MKDLELCKVLLILNYFKNRRFGSKLPEDKKNELAKNLLEHMWESPSISEVMDYIFKMRDNKGKKLSTSERTTFIDVFILYDRIIQIEKLGEAAREEHWEFTASEEERKEAIESYGLYLIEP